MSAGAGVLRTASSLAETAADLVDLGVRSVPANTASWEAANLLTVASAVVAAAARRDETRGCHWREDFPETDDAWRGHLLARIGADDQVTEAWEPMDDR
jgi:L-aspartate oxidase